MTASAGGPEGVVSRKIDLDDMLVQDLGQFGRYQLRTLLLCLVLVIFSAWSASEYVFTTARINTRCLIPECDDASDPEFSPPWLLNAVNGTSSTSFDACERFPNTTSAAGSASEHHTCPASLFDRNTTVECDGHVYENTHSVVYDLDLACQEWRRSLVGTVRTFGVLTALPITGFTSDTWGRKVALAINAFNTAWMGIVRYWADTYVGFMMSEFFEAMFGSGGFSCAYILLMELVGPKYRTAAGAAMNTCFSIGQVTLGFIAWAVPNWRHLTLALYVPQLITISYFWIMSESIRWLMSKGRYEESEMILRKVAEVNRRTLSEKSLKSLRDSAEDERRREESETEHTWLVQLVFQHKPILLRCVVSPVWWVTTTFVYYGLSINAVNMSGNRYLNFIAVSAVEVPGYWTSFYLINVVGRKPVLVAAFWTCAACQMGFILVPPSFYAASLTIYLIGKYAIAVVMTAVYVYTTELYPTSHRHSLFAYSSMIGRVGAMVAPLTPALAKTVWVHLPFALFGGISLVSGGLVLLTPETLGCQLPDTFEQADELSTRKKDVT